MTILVAINHDSVRDAVLGVAIELAKGLDQELYVVHLVDDEVADQEAKNVRDEIRNRIADENVVATVAIEHVSHIGARPHNRIGRELLDLATDVEISHIVMGHSSKGLLAKLTQGDAAYAVLEDSNVPVTIVPNGAKTSAGRD